jgi:hypothetical protein
MGRACGTCLGEDKLTQVGVPAVRRTGLLEHQHINASIISKGILKEYDRKTESGFIWLRIGTGVGLL